MNDRGLEEAEGPPRSAQGSSDHAPPNTDGYGGRALPTFAKRSRRDGPGLLWFDVAQHVRQSPPLVPWTGQVFGEGRNEGSNYYEGVVGQHGHGYEKAELVSVSGL